jgi:hypothetical protein
MIFPGFVEVFHLIFSMRKENSEVPERIALAIKICLEGGSTAGLQGNKHPSRTGRKIPVCTGIRGGSPPRKKENRH